MNELENRLRRAGSLPPSGSGPNLDAITRRGSARLRNKRIGAGIGAAAIVAVAAVGLGARLSDRPTLIEAADGESEVTGTGEADGDSADGVGGNPDDDLDGNADGEGGRSEPGGSGGTGEGGINESANDGSGDGDGASTGDTGDAGAAGEAETMLLADRLADRTPAGTICFSYDDPRAGTGFLRLTIDDDTGRVVVEENRTRGGVDDPANVWLFDGATDDTGLVVEVDGLFSSEGAIEAEATTRRYEIAPGLDGTTGMGLVFDTLGCPDASEPTGAPAPVEDAVSDGLGGWLAVSDGRLVHLRADGAEVVIDLPSDSNGGQTWVTDVAPIDGVPYLFLDRFVNRDPSDGREVDFLVTIHALNLRTDELVLVEERRIETIASPEWTYNGHITTDGSRILVMRELWQSFCLYAEGLTLDGTPVDVPQSVDYPRPDGLDELTTEDVERIQGGSTDGISPCIDLVAVPDGGVEALGRHADPAEWEAFSLAFSRALG